MGVVDVCDAVWSCYITILLVKEIKTLSNPLLDVLNVGLNIGVIFIPALLFAKDGS
jgi:hypothetical protein